LSEVASTFESFGYSSEIGGAMRGVSGVLHEFDIVSKKDGYSIVVEVLPSFNETAIMKLISLRIKAWDCSPDLVVVITPKNFEETELVKEMESLYNFARIDGSDQERVCAEIKNSLASLDESIEVAISEQ
jgi:hypothetical protein